jgi:hypothetical protein
MLKIIAYHSEFIDGKTLITNSEGQSVFSDNFNELISFISERYAFDIKVAWDLDVMVSMIIRYLPTYKLLELAGVKHETSGLFYIPHILFMINSNEQKSFFYHLAQYYPELPEVTDVMEIKQKAQDILDALKKMKQYPAKLTSPASIYESTTMRHFVLPNINDLPQDGSMDEIVTYAETTIGRSWVEAFKIGHWKVNEIYSLDLSSAYPFQASKLYNYRYSKIKQSDKIPNDINPDSWGWMIGRITINDDVLVSPIMYKQPDGMTINPIGSWDKEGTDNHPYVLTLDEYNWIKKWNIGKFEIYNGYFVNFFSKVQPYALPMQRLFEQRSISLLCKMLAKRQAASATGKIIQQTAEYDEATDTAIQKPTKYYDPLSASIIRTRTRLQVSEFIYKHSLQPHIAHVGTDGIQSEKIIDIPKLNQMGAWKLNNPTDTLIVSSGRVYFGDKHPFGLDHDMIIDMINNKPRSSYYENKISRRITLADCVDSQDFSHIGELQEYPSTLDLTILKLDNDRTFPKFPKTGKDLLSTKYNSVPLEVRL